jgi:hypothetical protein
VRRLAIVGVLLVLAGLGVWAARQAGPWTKARPGAAPPLAVLTSSAHPELAVPAGGCGPARVVDGVPVGWQASQTGAVSAAAAYAKVMSAPWFLTDRDRRHRAIALIATPEQAASLTASQDLLADGLAGVGTPREGLTTALLGWRVEAFPADSARVVLWAVVVDGPETGLLPSATWATTTMQLAWAGGDWKLVSAQTAPGPTPPPGGGATSSFRGFVDVPA